MNFTIESFLKTSVYSRDDAAIGLQRFSLETAASADLAGLSRSDENAPNQRTSRVARRAVKSGKAAGVKKTSIMKTRFFFQTARREEYKATLEAAVSKHPDQWKKVAEELQRQGLFFDKNLSCLADWSEKQWKSLVASVPEWSPEFGTVPVDFSLTKAQIAQLGKL
ncbi:MAG: hypothetical protein HN411_05925 [Waddliaceae bacterium]|jgi:hypothetical protein|nr:hypothetical protein [Waddliaceae bacterium]MBT3579057.1 hypothetical protein [Waddliaceae bacterium]MBT4444490.1 hypothetical protein [Waddliaceae bacterium]MBT6929079.1 hypothetical protein [Waddliaceae bacterium]MBT7264739.1 hypothetical protein [Waddliaceae bacterium]